MGLVLALAQPLVGTAEHRLEDIGGIDGQIVAIGRRNGGEQQTSEVRL